MSRFTLRSWSLAPGIVVTLILAACAPSAALTPTAAPAKPVAQPPAAPAVQRTAPAPQATAPAAAPKTAASDAQMNELYQRARASGQTKITHYATFGAEVDPMIGQFQRRFSEIQVERVQLRTPDIIQRLAAEGAAGRRIANVVSAGATSMTTVEQAGHLLEWEGPSNASELQGVPLSQGRTRWAYTTNIFGLIVNTSLVPENKIPRTRQDVLDPFWKGKGQMLVSDPRTGGTGLEYFTINYHQLGQEYLERFKAQEPTWTRDVAANVAQQVARGEYAMYFPVGVTSELLEMEKIAPVKVDWMRDGGSTAVELNVGVVKDAPNPDAAKLWVTWLVSEEGQRGVVQYIQQHAALPYLPPPAGYPSVQEINPQRRTDDQIRRNNEYVELFERTFFQ